MTTAPVDPRLALDAADASEMVQKKLSIDAMRKRVTGGVSEEKKMREACEGFESVFLQKMWEQMRKNVHKEGYLHSKDEETYQSMFDVELAKKMASAGGIGLADMLYEQLSQKLTDASKTTGSGAPRTPLPIEPASGPLLAKPGTSLPLEGLYSETEPVPAGKPDVLGNALADLAASRDPANDPANATYPMFDLQTGAPKNPVAERQKEASAPEREVAVTPMPAKVNAPGKVRPYNAVGGVGRPSRQARKKATQPDAFRQVESLSSRPAQGAEAEGARNAPAGPTKGHQPPEPVTPEDWATGGGMVSSYQNQARSLQDSGRAAWSRIA